MSELLSSLSAQKGWIFRITHRDNIPWILRHGLVSANDEPRDPDFVRIGDPELIAKRVAHPIPVPPGGTLSDYIAFYFTPFSPMAYKICTGNGVARRSSDEIVVLLSSLEKLDSAGIPYLFTDRHAYLQTARFYSKKEELRELDFDLFRRRDFKRSADDPGRIERYQAEALVYRRLPTNALLALACYTPETASSLLAKVKEQGVDLKVVHRPGWYFP